MGKEHGSTNVKCRRSSFPVGEPTSHIHRAHQRQKSELDMLEPGIEPKVSRCTSSMSTNVIACAHLATCVVTGQESASSMCTFVVSRVRRRLLFRKDVTVTCISHANGPDKRACTSWTWCERRHRYTEGVRRPSTQPTVRVKVIVGQRLSNRQSTRNFVAPDDNAGAAAAVRVRENFEENHKLAPRHNQ